MDRDFKSALDRLKPKTSKDSGEKTPLDAISSVSEAVANSFERESGQSASQQLEVLLEELPSQYQVMGKISEGGMGAVFKARNLYTDALVAIKVMRPETAKDEQALKRFNLEARSASALRHPHICRVLDFGLTRSNMPYLVMDWISGISLGMKISRDERLLVAEALRVFQQIASALQHAHDNSVIHRDLKPENIMLIRDEDGRTNVQLVDFGIAKVLKDDGNSLEGVGLTRTGIVIGTPMYMSPEQARGERIDARTDIYALGCLMYYAVTGKPPFLGATVIDTLTKHCNEAPPDIDSSLKIPPDVRLLILRCMEKDPKDRYQSMDLLLSDLKKVGKGVTIERKKLAIDRTSDKKKRLTVLSFLMGFILMYLLSLGIQALLDSSNHGGSVKHNHSTDADK